MVQQDGDPATLWLRSVLVRYGAADAALAGDLAEATPEDVAQAWWIGRAHRAVGREIPAMCLGFAAPTLVAAEATADERWQAIWLVLASEGLETHAAVLQRTYEGLLRARAPGPGTRRPRGAGRTDGYAAARGNRRRAPE